VQFVMGGVEVTEVTEEAGERTVFRKDHPKLPATVKRSRVVPLAYDTRDANVNLTCLGGDAMEHKAAPPPVAQPNLPPARAGHGRAAECRGARTGSRPPTDR